LSTLGVRARNDSGLAGCEHQLKPSPQRQELQQHQQPQQKHQQQQQKRHGQIRDNFVSARINNQQTLNEDYIVNNNRVNQQGEKQPHRAFGTFANGGSANAAASAAGTTNGVRSSGDTHANAIGVSSPFK